LNHATHARFAQSVKSRINPLPFGSSSETIRHVSFADTMPKESRIRAIAPNSGVSKEKHGLFARPGGDLKFGLEMQVRAGRIEGRGRNLCLEILSAGDSTHSHCQEPVVRQFPSSV